MKIALVHYTAAPVVGGVERVMDEHARLFVENGHDVTVLSQRGGGPDAVRLPQNQSVREHEAALHHALGECDLVFVHNVLTMPFHSGLTEALSKTIDCLPRTRFVAWVHDVAACNPDYAPVSALFTKAHPRCEYIAVSDLRARQFAKATGVQCRAVIPNGIDPARVLGLPANVAAFAQRHRLLDGRLILLHPTRLVLRKNVGLSIAVAREFSDRGTPATVIVTAADDPHNASANTLAAKLRSECALLNNVIFAGDHLSVGDSELAGLYQLADALLFPSRSEGFGLPLLEAALHRLPAFCSDIEPLRGLLRETASHFSPDEEPASLATRIEDTLSACPAFREKKRVLREFSWAAIYRKHLAPLLAGTLS